MHIPTEAQALYSIGTWDSGAQAYTPQVGVTGPSINIQLGELRRRMRELRRMHYSAHRRRDANGCRDDNDWAVLIERTDGRSEAEILEGWKR